MLKKIFKKENIAGLDIGGSYIKWVEVEGEDLSSMTVTHYATEAIPKEFMPENGEFKDKDMEAVSELVRKCWIKSGSKTKRVAITLPPGQTITKKLSMGKEDTEAEMFEQVQENMVKYLPENMTLSDFSIDYSIIRTNERNENEYDVNIVATKKENLDSRLAIIEMAGLDPVIVDVEQYSIQNMVRLMRGVNFLEGVWILADCSGTMLRIWVFKNGEIVYNRDTPIGGINMTQEVAANLKVSFEEAESFKVSHGVRNDIKVMDDMETTEIYEMVEKSFLNNYVAEFIRAFSYITSATSVNEVDEIILAGGVASIKNLPELLEKALLEETDIVIKNTPYVARLFSDKKYDENLKKVSKVDLIKYAQDEPGLFLATSLALRKYLREY